MLRILILQATQEMQLLILWIRYPVQIWLLYQKNLDWLIWLIMEVWFWVMVLPEVWLIPITISLVWILVIHQWIPSEVLLLPIIICFWSVLLWSLFWQLWHSGSTISWCLRRQVMITVMPKRVRVIWLTACSSLWRWWTPLCRSCQHGSV